jgi:hypothetical protein
VNRELAQRQLALAGVALVGGLFALAASPSAHHRNLPKAAGGWHTGAAAAGLPGGKTNCGYDLGKESLGLAHPTFPCNTKIYVAFHGKLVLTQVVANSPVRTGHAFELTRALAAEIGLKNTQEIRWSLVAAKEKK